MSVAVSPASLYAHHVYRKCSLEPTTDSISLGVDCDTVQRRLYAPEDKLLKSEMNLLEG